MNFLYPDSNHPVKRLPEQCSAFHQLIRRSHEVHLGTPQYREHAFTRTVVVAALALQLAEDGRTRFKAWLAAMLYPVRHLCEDLNTKEVMQSFLATIPRDLFEENLTDTEMEEVLKVATNPSEDGELQQIVREASMLSRLIPNEVMWTSQFLGEGSLERGSPASRAFDPKLYAGVELLRDRIQATLPQLKLQRSQMLAKSYAIDLDYFIQMVERNFANLGLRDIKL